MKRLFNLFAAVPVLAALLTPSIALAAKPSASGGGSSKPTPTVEYVGYDISYPQCGKSVPTDHYFGIVGVNGGNAATANDCLANQLVWANKAKAGSNQSK